jgi:hypothetical protein
MHVAVIARLPPEGADNWFYSWPELTKSRLTPRLESFATYTSTVGETRMMQELQAIGAAPASLRTEMEQPSNTSLSSLSKRSGCQAH